MIRAILLGGILCIALPRPPLEAQLGRTAQVVTPTDTVRLTIAAARSRALAQNPSFLAALESVTAAQGDLRTAGTYPYNPLAEAEGPGVLTEGRGRYEARLGQEIEWAGQRGLRLGAARAGLRATSSRTLDEARRLLGEVEAAFVSMAAAQERYRLAEEIEDLNRRLVEAVRVELGEGEVSVLEANLVEIEAARARARVLEAGRAVATANLALRRLMGLDPGPVIRVEADPSLSVADGDADIMVAAALEARPDLEAARSQVEEARSLQSLATRAALPNLRVSGIVEGEGGGADPRFGVALSLPVPLFDRNQGLRLRREAEVDRSRFDAGATAIRVRTEVLDAVQTYRASVRELAIYRSDILEPVRRNQGLLDTAYREGKLDLSSLLLLRNQLLDAELGYWEAWERHRRAAVAVRTATSAVLDDTALDLPSEDLR
ncbi:MAG: TolC family protein [Longimicrobiales bacterium]